MWAEFSKFLPTFKSAVITGIADNGYPVSTRCQPQIDASDQTLKLTLPAGVSIQAGPVSLLVHSHDENLWNQRSYMVRGRLQRTDDSWVLQPEKYTPGMGVHGVLGLINFVRGARRNAANYLKKRNLPRPTIPWAAIKAVKK